MFYKKKIDGNKLDFFSTAALYCPFHEFKIS